MNFGEWLEQYRKKNWEKTHKNFEEEYYVKSKDKAQTIRAIKREWAKELCIVIFNDVLMIMFGIIIGIFFILNWAITHARN